MKIISVELWYRKKLTLIIGIINFSIELNELYELYLCCVVYLLISLFLKLNLMFFSDLFGTIDEI